MGRSNMFANVENEVKKIPKEDLLQYAVDSFRGYAPVLQGNNRMLGFSITYAMNLAVMDDGKVGSEEEEFVRRWHEEILNIPYDDESKHDISQPLEEKDYDTLEKMLSAMAQIDPSSGINYLKFILAFAYSDGKFDDKVAEKLDGLFGMFLLTDFILSGQEEVPTPTNEVKVSKLEKEVYDYIQKTNGGPIDEIMKGFPNNSKSEIIKTLDLLVEKGTINRLDNIFNGPWYVN